MPQMRSEALSRQSSKDVWMGVRPEAITIRSGGRNGSHIPAEIDVVSPMGGNTLVYSRVGGETIVADVPSDIEPTVGEAVDLEIDPTRVHAFNTENEVALW